MKFAIDEDLCITNCDDCSCIAPQNFNGTAVVNQPESEREFNQCLDAMKACPMQAIYKVE